MRKIAALTLVLGLVVAPLATRALADEEPGNKHVVEDDYILPPRGVSLAGVYSSWLTDCDDSPDSTTGTPWGCATLLLDKPAETIEVEVIDDNRGPVLARIQLPGTTDYLTDICGSTDAPLEVGGATKIYVQVLAGTCADGTVSTPTQGIVRLTYKQLDD